MSSWVRDRVSSHGPFVVDSCLRGWFALFGLSPHSAAVEEVDDVEDEIDATTRLMMMMMKMSEVPL